jgi:hypothetical protein
MEDYYDDVEMPGSRLNIRFHDDEKTPEQTLIIPFMEGDGVRYFVARGVREGDRRITRCDIIRIMNWDQLIEYLGDVWEEMWDAMLFKLKTAEMNMP